jgi:hypothetical protein
VFPAHIGLVTAVLARGMAPDEARSSALEPGAAALGVKGETRLLAADERHASSARG